MAGEDTTPTAEETRAAEAVEQADFESGAAMETPAPKGTAKPGAAATEKPDAAAVEEKPAVVVEPKPEYVRVTRKDWDDVRAAAAKTANYDSQFSRAFGTLGGLQKALTALQTGTPRGGKIEIPKDAFAAMERDFPELAQHTRSALEATLRGLTGTGAADPDPEALTKLITEHSAKIRADAEIESLEDAYPDWGKIVGKVDVLKGEKPDPANAFRKWLATKDAAYQTRLNSTHSAAVISRAIDRFQAETKAPGRVAPTLEAQLADARRGRIAGAVKPRGDGGQAQGPATGEDEFAAGFAAG